MLKILSRSQIRELDAYTIQHDPIASIDLMENACQAFSNWYQDHFSAGKNIYIFCGTGNNGGDGLGIARILHGWNYDVRVFVITGSVPESPDFKINLDRLSKLILVNTINDAEEIPDCTKADIIIDGIFGSGLSRPVEGLYGTVIQAANNSSATRIAIDVPSGLRADQPSPGIIFKAHHTVTFQLPRLAFFLPENAWYVGDWHIVKIGLNKKFISSAPAHHFYLQRSDVFRILKPRSRFDHKGTFGSALLVAGSMGKMGAAVLSTRAALRSGAGLVTTHVPQKGIPVIQTAVPEAMAHPDSNEKWLSENFDMQAFDSLGIGPGLGMEKETIKAFEKILQSTSRPVVIDADGLNMLAANQALLHVVPRKSILTPHMKEFERLVGSWSNGFDRLEMQQQFAKRTQTVLVVKGAYTAITAPDGTIYFNATGNPGMATAGSGDVLTGILTGLLAQGYEPLDAALLGVYLHGLAGDIAVKKTGMQAMIASDIIDAMGKAFRKIME